MGIYTELVVAAELRRDVPDRVVAVLRYMIEDEGPRPLSWPDHELFKTDRWQIMLKCDSYHVPGETRSTLRRDEITTAYFLTVRTNLKNYDQEIQKFLDWLDPYVNDGDRSYCAGYYRYEVSREPTLIYWKGGE